MKPSFFLGFLLISVGSPGMDGAGGSLGLLSIFNKFIEVTDILGNVHPILQNIANGIVDDIRDLIPEVERLLDKYNISRELPKEMGKVINMTYILHEVVPELDKAMKEINMSSIVNEIRGYIRVSAIREELLPEYDKFMRENNVSDILNDIREVLDVDYIADNVLPELEKFMEEENISAIAMEIEKFLEMSDVSGKLVPAIINIMESHNVTQIFHELDNLLNISRIVDVLIPDLEWLIKEINLNDTVAEIKKIMNVVSYGHEALNDLQKLIDENNITYHVPDLEPFINLTILREKLTEVEKILNYTGIPDMVNEVERLLDMNYLRGRVHDIDDFLESLGLSKLLQDIKSLLDISFINDEVSAIKRFLRSGNLTDVVSDVEKRLLNATYIRNFIVPELKRMLLESNLTNWVDEAEHMMNSSTIKKDFLPDIEKFLEDHSIPDQLRMLLGFLNITILEEQLKLFDEQFNITRKGERIAKGDLPGVVNEVLDDIFKKETLVDETSTSPTTAPVKATTTEEPIVCIDDCQGNPCGTAIINSCGICVLGTTGYDVNQGKDCNKVCNGRARIDKCNKCTNPPVNDRTGTDSPFTDCHGTCFGKAVKDACNDCSGGRTGKVVDYNKDACGVCAGDNSTCKGCDGVPNSGKVQDSCGVCGGDGTSCTTLTSVTPGLMPTSSTSKRTVTVFGAGLLGDGADSIKCVFDGQESQGVSINQTHVTCDIPNDITAGEKDFTVKVVKSGTKVATADLKIKIYDSTATKITSVAPAELFTKEPFTLTLTGNGLTQSDKAICMARGHTIRALYESGSYKCSVPSVPVSMKVTVAFSLNGVHEIASDVSLVLTIFARAPTIVGARFSATGALIGVRFDKNIDKSSLGTCADIFASGSLTSLGTSPKCKWSDERNLIIAPGSDATIEPDNSVTLKTDALKNARETYSKYASGQVSVSAPSNPKPAVAVIFGPKQVSSCGNLSLDASQSSGGGGRALKYKWTLIATTNADITSALNAAVDKSKVLIESGFMTAGSSYTIRLEVKNFLSSSWQSTTITVNKVASASPEVRVDGPSEGKVKPSDRFYLKARARAASCSNDKALKYTWTVVCTNDDVKKSAQAKLENSDGFGKTSSKAVLKIDAEKLVGGKTYTFKVVVALIADPSTWTTVETTITGESSDLEAGILGGDRTLGRDSGDLELDAKSSTYDPDKAPGSLSCSWVCEEKSTGQPCYSASSEGTKVAMADLCVITVASSEFEAGKSYEITSHVSKGLRTASSSIVLTVVAGKPPVVMVLTQKIRVSASERVRLRGVFKSDVKPVKVEWSCVQDDDHRYIDLNDTSLFSSSSNTYYPGKRSFAVKVLKQNVLTPGATYKFTLKVDDGTNVASTHLTVEVRNGPTSGNFETSSESLTALKKITLKALRWVTSSDAYPLSYQFGFLDVKDLFQPWVTQSENEYTTFVPPGYGANNKLTLRMIVKDAFGSMESVDKIIVVAPISTFNTEEVEDVIADNLQKARNNKDFASAIPQICNFMLAVSNSPGASEALSKKISENAVETVIEAVSASLDKDLVKPILKTMLNVQAKYVGKSKVNQMMSRAKDVLKASESLDKGTAESTLVWATSLAGEADLKDKDVLTDLSELYQSVGDGLAADVDIGETLETAVENVPAVIKVAYFGLDTSVAAKSGSDATDVDFGDELSEKFGMWECSTGKMCYGAKLSMISYDADYFSGLNSESTPSNATILSDKIVSISLKNPETDESLTVTGLSKPITLKFKTGSPSSGKQFGCFYFHEEEKKWLSDGITCTQIGDEVVGLVTHMTAFSPAEVDVTSQSSEKSYQLSFVLSNTTWINDYSDSNDANYTALKNQILQEVSDVYQGDSTMKKLDMVKFEESGGLVKVVLKMTFDASNTNPSEKLKQEIADGKLGDIQVDPNSLDWVEVYDQSDDDDDNTNIIIGVVVGVTFAVALFAIVLACLCYHKKRPGKVRSHPRVNDGYEEQVEMAMGSRGSRQGLTPV